MARSVTHPLSNLGRKIASFLLLIGFAVIWQGLGAHRIAAPRPEPGRIAANLVPDDGLRPHIQAIERRAEDRKSGPLPDLMALNAQAGDGRSTHATPLFPSLLAILRDGASPAHAQARAPPKGAA